MITLRQLADGALGDPQRIETSEVASLPLGAEDTTLWLDLEAPDDDAISAIAERFSLHELAIEDTRHRGQRPKAEAYDHHLFVVLQSITLGADGDLVAGEVHAFAGKDFLITLRFDPAMDLEPVLRRCRGRSDLAREGGAFLLYTVLDEVVDNVFAVIDSFEDAGDELEERVFVEPPSTDLQQAIYKLKRQIVELRRFVLPLRELVDRIGEQSWFVTDPLRLYYRDVADHILRELEFIDLLRDLTTSSMEAELSQVSNALNQTMKRVTSYGAILLVPTLIAGVYGMNFRQMPELGWQLGYPAALLLIVGSMVGLYFWFKKKGYL